MSPQHKKWLKYCLYAVLVLVVYVLLVYTYFQFEQFSPSQPDATLVDSLWYVVLNPTGLGSAGNFMTFPSTFFGKIISVVFVLTGLGMLGVFIGKIGDMFNEYREYRRLGYAGTDFENHHLIIGWNQFTELVVKQLLKSNQQVAVVTNRKADIDLIYDEYGTEDVFVLFTELDNYERFEKVNISAASRVLVSPGSDSDTLVTLLNLKDDYDGPEYVVTVRNEDLEETLVENGADYVVSRYRAASGLIASNIFEPDAAAYLNDLMTSVESEGDHELQQYYVKPDCELVGENCGEAFEFLYNELGCLLVGYSRPGDEERHLEILPSDADTIQAEDYLVLIVTNEIMGAVGNYFQVEQGLRF